MEKQIRDELILAYQRRYGDDWHMNLKKTLRPSPVTQIAQQLNVSVGKVRKVKQDIWVAGMLLDMIRGVNPPPLDTETI
jgi:hypothetical protein